MRTARSSPFKVPAAGDTKFSERLGRLYETLSRTNQAIARADCEATLLKDLCGIVVGHGDFVAAWVGLLDPDGRLRSTAAAGPAKGYADHIEVSADALDSHGRGPSGQVLRSGHHVICNDFLKDPRNAPWHALARRYNIAASVVMPLTYDGRVIGLLNVYSGTSGHFGPHEVAVLDDIAADISLGLANLRATLALKRGVEQRQQLLEQLDQIERTVRVGVFQVTLPSQAVWWSAGFSAVFGLDMDVVPSWNILENVLGPMGAEALRLAITEASCGNGELDLDLPVRGPEEAGEAWIRVTGRVHPVTENSVNARGIVEDITERRLLATQVRRAAADERHRLLSELHDNLGQLLAGGALLAALQERAVEKHAPSLLDDARRLAELLSECGKICRDLSHGRSTDFPDGLSGALARLASGTRSTAISCHLTAAAGVDALLTTPQCVELLRIAQEAVTNALKHAKCRHIGIDLKFSGGMIQLTVRDDGIGIGIGHTGSGDGMGVRTMRFRAARIGGTLHLQCARNGGTCVSISVPRLAASNR
jgi:signal transduction histidine kinase/putative methionine-R-sulfoxide reductase with GAF domain